MKRALCRRLGHRKVAVTVPQVISFTHGQITGLIVEQVGVGVVCLRCRDAW